MLLLGSCYTGKKVKKHRDKIGKNVQKFQYQSTLHVYLEQQSTQHVATVFTCRPSGNTEAASRFFLSLCIRLRILCIRIGCPIWYSNLTNCSGNFVNSFWHKNLFTASGRSTSQNFVQVETSAGALRHPPWYPKSSWNGDKCEIRKRKTEHKGMDWVYVKSQ